MIEVKKTLDTHDYLWCREAALIKVSSGRKALTEVYSEPTDDYTVKSHLLLNGKPIMQDEAPGCPTCCSLLARGCGIENTGCDELKIIRDKINSEYTDLRTGIKNIEPILDLLDDGHYLVADALLYPTDGSDRFFANVKDELSCIRAATDQYYNSEFIEVTKGFPAYLYPTQSNSALNSGRADFYLDKIDKDNAPRAVAYYDCGFICALLDGHHKAYAAAKKGCLLPTLVIIPFSGIGEDRRKQEKYAYFADITLPLHELAGFEAKNERKIKNQAVEFKEYHNDPIPEDDLCLDFYPTVDELTGLYASGAEKLDITAELVLQWIKSTDSNDRERLGCVLRYYAKREPERAYTIARTVVTSVKETVGLTELIRFSYKVIAAHKCDESEQLMINYLIDHDKSGAAWEICNSYW
ncbi:MAG: hypothetical protein K6C13_10135 [Oscillospiraceae bacterium]|nr:hypothetical protein [Oscillospiraceae bacterium]